MAQDQTTVSPGPGWVDFAGEGRIDEADEVSLNVEAQRFGPATIASIRVHADGGVTDAGTYVEVGVELTLGDAIAIVESLKPIIRAAILDGYDGYNADGNSTDELPERADDWDLFEVSLCGEMTNAFDDGTNAVERIDGREEFDLHDRYFYTVYGVHNAVEDPRTGETRPHSEPSLALLDIDGGDWDARTKAIAAALDLAQGRPVYLIEDGSYNQVAIR